MSVTYTNRKGRTYYLCQGTTKTGKPRYFFSPELKGKPLEEIPEGYAIRESVNGIVSLAKARPMLLLEHEVGAVKAALQKHAKAKRYRLDVKPEQFVIYEQVGPGAEEFAEILGARSGLGGFMMEDFARRLEEEERIYTQYMAIMRFTLTDEKERLFKAERMCFLGSIDDWIDIEFNKPIEELATALIPTLGTDEFFELF